MSPRRSARLSEAPTAPSAEGSVEPSTIPKATRAKKVASDDKAGRVNRSKSPEVDGKKPKGVSKKTATPSTRRTSSVGNASTTATNGDHERDLPGHAVIYEWDGAFPSQSVCAMHIAAEEMRYESPSGIWEKLGEQVRILCALLVDDLPDGPYEKNVKDDMDQALRKVADKPGLYYDDKDYGRRMLLEAYIWHEITDALGPYELALADAKRDEEPREDDVRNAIAAWNGLWTTAGLLWREGNMGGPFGFSEFEHNFYQWKALGTRLLYSCWDSYGQDPDGTLRASLQSFYAGVSGGQKGWHDLSEEASGLIKSISQDAVRFHLLINCRPLAGHFVRLDPGMDMDPEEGELDFGITQKPGEIPKVGLVLRPGYTVDMMKPGTNCMSQWGHTQRFKRQCVNGELPIYINASRFVSVGKRRKTT